MYRAVKRLAGQVLAGNRPMLSLLRSLGFSPSAPAEDQVIQVELVLVATWQGALRCLQIHGFALLMILGVSQRLFHHFYGLPAPNRRLSLVALVCLNAAVLGVALSSILHVGSGFVWIGVWYASVLLLAGAVAALVWNWHIFAAAELSVRVEMARP